MTKKKDGPPDPDPDPVVVDPLTGDPEPPVSPQSDAVPQWARDLEARVAKAEEGTQTIRSVLTNVRRFVNKQSMFFKIGEFPWDASPK